MRKPLSLLFSAVILSTLPGCLVSVPESMSKPAECVDINVHGLLNVLARTVYLFSASNDLIDGKAGPS